MLYPKWIKQFELLSLLHVMNFGPDRDLWLTSAKQKHLKAIIHPSIIIYRREQVIAKV